MTSSGCSRSNGASHKGELLLQSLIHIAHQIP
jgi:hypothetical protein